MTNHIEPSTLICMVPHASSLPCIAHQRGSRWGWSGSSQGIALRATTAEWSFMSHRSPITACMQGACSGSSCRGSGGVVARAHLGLLQARGGGSLRVHVCGLP